MFVSQKTTEINENFGATKYIIPNLGVGTIYFVVIARNLVDLYP